MSLGSQNGFRTIRETDGAGWSALHYAALCGDPALLNGLLKLRADPKQLTKKGQWRLGLSPGTPALAISLLFKHNNVSDALIAAGANLDAGPIHSPIHAAVIGNNPEGIRLLCGAGCKLPGAKIFGFKAETAACHHASMLALEEFLIAYRARGQAFDVRQMLYGLVTSAVQPSAKLVERIVELRADVNQPFDAYVYRNLGTPCGLLVSALSLRYRSGKATKGTRSAYHSQGAPPLVMAVLTWQWQWEGAAALLLAGARPDLRNAHGMSASDLLCESQVPDFLAQGFKGELAECERVVSLARSGPLVQIYF